MRWSIKKQTETEEGNSKILPEAADNMHLDSRGSYGIAVVLLSLPKEKLQIYGSSKVDMLVILL